MIAYRTENHGFDPWLGQTKAKKKKPVFAASLLYTQRGEVRTEQWLSGELVEKDIHL